MSIIAVGGFQHETNTFAPSKADYSAFEQGGGWPELTFGDAIAPRLAGANIPATGALDALHAAGHRTHCGPRQRAGPGRTSTVAADCGHIGRFHRHGPADEPARRAGRCRCNNDK